LRRLPSGYRTTLPLCHDWTRVVALSSSFSTYKYKGRGGKKKKTKEKTGVDIKRKQRGKGPNRGKIEKHRG